MSGKTEQSFAKLFRHSKFARLDPAIPRVYVASPLPSPALLLEQGKEEVDSRPAFFGFKRDIHPTHYGQSLRYVQMCTLDGRYGLPRLRNGQDRVRLYRVMYELQRLAGTTSEHSAGIFFSDFSSRPPLQAQGVRIPGRVLNTLSGGGYAIGIAGIVAELPNAEIPPLQHFTADDIVHHRTFYFYVRSAEMDPQGRPRVILSLRAPQ